MEMFDLIKKNMFCSTQLINHQVGLIKNFKFDWI